MKKLVLMFCFVVIPGILAAQGWRQALERTYPSFGDVAFLDGNIAYAVGGSGIIYKSTDAGATWNPQQSNVTTTLSCVAFATPLVGFVGTTNRTLLSTTDGGNTWTNTVLSQIPEATASINAIAFADANTGYLLTRKSQDTCRILKTTDGGATWNLAGAKYRLATSSEDVLNLAVNGQNGVVVGKPHTVTFYTTDGFATWTRATLPTPLTAAYTYTRSDLWAVAMPTASIVYAAGWGSSAAGLQPTVYVKSTDGGATWSYMAQATEDLTFDNLYGMTFKDASTGIGVGANGLVVKTTDGGVSWKYVDAQVGATLQSVASVRDSVIVVGDDGVVLRTPDFGMNGEMITKIPAFSLYAIETVSSTVMIAGGYNGGIVQTTDGGATWFAYYLKANRLSPRVNDFSFVNDRVGYVSCNNRVVAKTTNSGGEWTIVLPETLATTFYLNGVWFTSELIGYVVGQCSTNVDCIYMTTDGGATWTLLQNTSASNLKRLNDVCFADPQRGVAVGDAMKIVTTANAGGNWTLTTATGVPTAVGTTNNLRRVGFANDSVAYAVGQKAILKSIDYGQTWAFYDSSSTADFYDVKFNRSTGIGYIIGTLKIMKTTDHGATWSDNILDTTVTHKGTLYGGTIDAGGNLWVSSGFSSIFTNAPITAVEGTERSVPLNPALDQNYPNPFNPTTVISYRLSVASDVDLRVFDMLGREVAHLFHGIQQAGMHTATFDAGSLTSGVYMYRLTTNGYAKAMKMLLVK